MAFCGEKNQKLLFEVGSLLKFRKFLPHTPCFTLIEQALSAFLTLIMFNEPWILPDVVYVIDFTFFHEGEYDS